MSAWNPPARPNSLSGLSKSTHTLPLVVFTTRTISPLLETVGTIPKDTDSSNDSSIFWSAEILRVQWSNSTRVPSAEKPCREPYPSGFGILSSSLPLKSATRSGPQPWRNNRPAPMIFARVTQLDRGSARVVCGVIRMNSGGTWKDPAFSPWIFSTRTSFCLRITTKSSETDRIRPSPSRNCSNCGTRRYSIQPSIKWLRATKFPCCSVPTGRRSPRFSGRTVGLAT
jgi:hypothetical protein